MDIYTASIEDLKKYLIECATEKDYRRSTKKAGAPGTSDDLALMSSFALHEHHLEVIREAARRDTGPRYIATIK